MNMLKHKDVSVIYTHVEKTKLLSERGIDIYIEHPLRKPFPPSAGRFCERNSVEKMGMKILVVGDDCGFGYKRRGNVELLKQMEKRS